MYKNFRIYVTETGTFVVKADSKRFGKHVIVCEAYDVKTCWKWIQANYRNKSGKVITNARLVDRVYRMAMSTCNISNNFWYQK